MLIISIPLYNTLIYHFAQTGNIKIDRALQIVLYGVGCGMSGSWWRNQHNKHHAMPQKIGHDVDLNTLPLVAFTEKVRETSSAKPFKLLQELARQ